MFLYLCAQLSGAQDTCGPFDTQTLKGETTATWAAGAGRPSLQLCFGAFLLTIRVFVLTVGASLVTMEAILPTVGKCLQ